MFNIIKHKTNNNSIFYHHHQKQKKTKLWPLRQTGAFIFGSRDLNEETTSHTGKDYVRWVSLFIFCENQTSESFVCFVCRPWSVWLVVQEEKVCFFSCVCTVIVINYNKNKIEEEILLHFWLLYLRQIFFKLNKSKWTNDLNKKKKKKKKSTKLRLLTDKTNISCFIFKQIKWKLFVLVERKK